MSAPQEAFERLEKLVREASEQLKRLHEENAALGEENEKLRQQLDDASALGNRAADLEASWQSERQAIAERVGKLADGLDELLSTAQG